MLIEGKSSDRLTGENFASVFMYGKIWNKKADEMYSESFESVPELDLDFGLLLFICFVEIVHAIILF